MTYKYGFVLEEDLASESSVVRRFAIVTAGPRQAYTIPLLFFLQTSSSHRLCKNHARNSKAIHILYMTRRRDHVFLVGTIPVKPWFRRLWIDNVKKGVGEIR